jgi:AraC-like DNA-binding protein
MTEVAAILGYAHPGAFTRAFRRWSDTTPRSSREERIDARAEMSSIIS